MGTDYKVLFALDFASRGRGMPAEVVGRPERPQRDGESSSSNGSKEADKGAGTSLLPVEEHFAAIRMDEERLFLQRFMLAEKTKEKGNGAFKKCDFEDAAAQYLKVVYIFGMHTLSLHSQFVLRSRLVCTCGRARGNAGVHVQRWSMCADERGSSASEFAHS